MRDGETTRPETLFEAPPLAEQERMVEAILFASATPVTVGELHARLPHGCDAPAALEQLAKRYDGRGVRVARVGDAWGNKGPAVWIAKMNQNFRTGAPIQWIQKKVVCPNCAAESYARGGLHFFRAPRNFGI